jgi:hypothetical protein
MLRTALVPIFLACLVPVHGQAQSAAMGDSPAGEIQRPPLTVGDSWRYRRTDGFTRVTRGEFTFKVTEVGEAQITFVRDSDRIGLLKVVTTKELNTLSVGEGESVRRFKPHYPLFAFPLAPGKFWSSNVEFPNRHHRLVRSSANGRVLSWEGVSVPAGTFDALKLTVDSNYTVGDNPFRKGQLTESCWYVPSIRRCAKYTFRDWNWDYNEWFIDELVRYDLQR